MKKLFTILCAGLIMIACTSNKQSVNSKDLQGKYNVDFSALLSEFDDAEDDELGLAKAFAAMILSSLNMTMQFDDDKLIIDGNSTALEIMSSFAKDEESPIPMTLDYEIRDDSVLYTRSGDDEFEYNGILRKLNNSYDSLQLVTPNEDDEDMVLVLRKVKD